MSQPLQLVSGEEETITGVVQNVIFASDNGRYSVIRIKFDDDRGGTAVVLQTEPPPLGQKIEFRGKWVVHPRFGLQFKADGLKMVTPTSLEGIERYLGSGVIKGLGPGTASRLVEAFGSKTLEVIEKKPALLETLPGIGKKTSKKIHDSFMEQNKLRDLMLWLEGRGISGSFAARLETKYGENAILTVQSRPYSLAKEVSGIGFLTADHIAMQVGVKKNAPERIAAGLDYALYQFAQSGHTCMPRSYLMENTAKLLSSEEDDIRPVLKKQIQNGELTAVDCGDEELIYTENLYRAETETARRLIHLKEMPKRFELDTAVKLVNKWESGHQIRLAAKQREAVAAALIHGVFVLTGGPGTGKTTVVRAMLDILEKQELTIKLGAPTGRAAKRLQETTGREALTVHRLLEVQMMSENENFSLKFARNYANPLEADVVILDEVSMMDIVLMRHFLNAIPPDCSLILVGDADQLPSVGPGTVLKDILLSEVIPSVRLTEIFRQAGRGDLVYNAHAINFGKMPICSRKFEDEFMFLEFDDPAIIIEFILAFCAELLPEIGFDAMRDIQVLSPMHRQECGVDNLNNRLQAVLNPPAEDKPEIVSGSKIFRQGDKVMQIKNNYKKKVFNGDIGFITDLAEDRLYVSFDDNKPIVYEKKEFVELQLAYALSVHKSQGNEYRAVIMPLIMSHYIMLQRNLLYTAVTRAKERVILLGEKKALAMAVGNDRMKKRFSLLRERLYTLANEYDEYDEFM